MNTAWQRIVLAAEDLHLVTLNSIAAAEIAASTDGEAPEGSGHRLEGRDRYTRADIGPGAVWARSADGSMDEATIVVSLS
ncbi:hypothetical protein CGK74_14555 [Thauera propionica]|uniref:Uncharacterized protein n=1 Tax=Thauera propionica TaxID=2019431 RepID=A0A235EXB7_9RHOO|nr:hypothetical protein CGK74_14555 [Thauera propionica]